MGKKVMRNISGLLEHAATIKGNTEETVERAIDTLEHSKTKKINFKTVSELSGVSTTTLYNNPVLRDRISSLRAIEKTKSIPIVSDKSTRDKEQELRREIQKLKEEKKMLITQLVEMEQLKIENQRLKALLSQKRLE